MLGHLKPGVTPAQAVADLNSIGSYLEKTYPKDDGKISFTLARPGLYGSFLGGPVRAFRCGIDAAGGADSAGRMRQPGQPVCGASRRPFAGSCSAAGAGIKPRSHSAAALDRSDADFARRRRASDLWAALRCCAQLSVWQPFPRFPIHVPVSPDAKVYVVALVLALVSGLLFGIVPVRQVFRTNPYEVVKAGSTGTVGRRLTARDVLLVVQIAICAVLVTSSMVAVRGLMRSLHSNFGFEPRERRCWRKPS